MQCVHRSLPPPGAAPPPPVCGVLAIRDCHSLSHLLTLPTRAAIDDMIPETPSAHAVMTACCSRRLEMQQARLAVGAASDARIERAAAAHRSNLLWLPCTSSVIHIDQCISNASRSPNHSIHPPASNTNTRPIVTPDHSKNNFLSSRSASRLRA